MLVRPEMMVVHSTSNAGVQRGRKIQALHVVLVVGGQLLELVRWRRAAQILAGRRRQRFRHHLLLVADFYLAERGRAQVGGVAGVTWGEGERNGSIG